MKFYGKVRHSDTYLTTTPSFRIMSRQEKAKELVGAGKELAKARLSLVNDYEKVITDQERVTINQGGHPSGPYSSASQVKNHYTRIHPRIVRN